MDGDFRTEFVREPSALKHHPALVLNADYRPLSYYPLSLWPWQDAVKALTGGRGVDQVIEVGGPGTLERSIQSVRVGGRISLIGILTGTAGQVNPTPVMRNSITVDGIYVGSRAMFEDMNRAIAANALKPVIDTVLPFTEARAAYHRMRAGDHFGKIVVSIGDEK